MRWQSKPLPENHERRIVRKFALTPKRLVDSGVTVWLKHHWQCQYWLTRSEGDGGWWCSQGSVENIFIAQTWKDEKGYPTSVREFLRVAK